METQLIEIMDVTVTYDENLAAQALFESMFDADHTPLVDTRTPGQVREG